MKIKPIIRERLQTNHTSFVVDLILEYNITFIQGDSGVGKSAMFSFLKELSVENKEIKCINYLDKNSSYKNSIKKSKGKIFIIDNADILLDDALRSYISTDCNNQYIIIGRNPTGLLLDASEIYELITENVNGKTVIRIGKAFVD